MEPNHVLVDVVAQGSSIIPGSHVDNGSGKREFVGANPRAISRVHVGAGIVEPRLNETGRDLNGLRLIKAEYLATGGAFVVHDQPAELLPGVWFTGPVPRPNPEKNWHKGLWRVAAGGRVEDNVPEDSTLVFDTDKGTVILPGCGHAGMVNIAEYARTIAGQEPLLAVAGGLPPAGVNLAESQDGDRKRGRIILHAWRWHRPARARPLIL